MKRLVDFLPECLENISAQKQKNGNKMNQDKMDLSKNLQLKILPERYIEANISNLDEKIIKSIKPFLDNPEGFLVIAGITGCGKTYAACALVREFFKKSTSVSFTSQEKINLEWLSLNSQGKTYDFFLRLVAPELLVIDEIGVKHPSEAFLGFFYSVINERYNNPRCATIITTNMSSTVISEQFGDQVVSRIGSGLIVKIDGEDRRLIGRKSFGMSSNALNSTQDQR